LALTVSSALQIKRTAVFADQVAMNKSHISIGFASALLFAMISPLHAYADSTQNLLIGTSDAFEGTLDLSVALDDNSVAQGFNATASSTNQTKSFSVSDLPAGIVLYTDQGHDVVTVKSTDFDPAHGGDLVVTYLTNGLSNNYQSVTVEVERTGNQWQTLVNDQSGHHVVTQAYFKANTVFGQVVGIKSITFK
jgi:hypothetical protein